MLVSLRGRLKAFQAACVAVIVTVAMVVVPPELSKASPVRVVDMAAIQLQAAIAPILSAATNSASVVTSVTTPTQSKTAHAAALAAAEADGSNAL